MKVLMKLVPQKQRCVVASNIIDSLLEAPTYVDLENKGFLGAFSRCDNIPVLRVRDS